MLSKIAILQHAVSSPLNALLINLDLASKCNKENKSNLNYHLKIARLATNYLNKVIQNLIYPDRQEQFLVLEAIQEVISLIQNKTNLIQYFSINPNLKLLGNKFMFQESLICLINNAYESYKPNKINKIVTLSGCSDHQFLILNITDSGRGMNLFSQKINQISSFSTKESHQGIGLNFVRKNIKKQFNGKVNIISQKNKGSTVSLKIPI